MAKLEQAVKENGTKIDDYARATTPETHIAHFRTIENVDDIVSLSEINETQRPIMVSCF